jgi:hypothetical protein
VANNEGKKGLQQQQQMKRKRDSKKKVTGKNHGHQGKRT